MTQEGQQQQQADDVVSSLGDEALSDLGSYSVSRNHSYCHYQEQKRRLAFENINLLGRTKQLSGFLQALQRIRWGGTEFIAVSGDSGTGKSSLVEALREPVTMHANGFFVKGKFDLLRNEPFSAFVEAFSDLTDLVAQEHDDKALAAIAQDLEGEQHLLGNLIPNLSRVTHPSNNDRHNHHGTTISSSSSSLSELSASPSSLNEVVEAISGPNGKDVFARFKQACRKFLQATSTSQHPVLLFLDDLQWADEASIHVLMSLLTDPSSKHVLIVCTYRDNKTARSETTMQQFKDLISNRLDERHRFIVPCTNYILQDFELANVVDMVSLLLNLESSRTTPLCELILRRTNGNPYFVVQFLKLLEAQELLRFSDEIYSWVWDLTEILANTQICDNVADLLSTRVNALNEHVQSILKMAATLGFKFERSILGRVVRIVTPAFQDRVNATLASAESMGFIESSHHDENNNSILAFSHDGVYQCLFSLVADEPSWHLRIAQALSEISETMEKPDACVFMIANQLLRAKPALENPLEKVLTARASLKAANLAMSKSAIPLAAKYVDFGIEVLDAEAAWRDHYELALELYTTAIQLQYCRGRYDDCRHSVEQVRKHARTFRDSLAAETTLMSALGANGELNQAIDVSFSLARRLGMKLPKNPSMRHSIMEIIRTKKMLKGKTDSDLLQLPEDDQDDNTAGFRLLGQAAEYASLAGRIPHLCLAVLCLVQTAVENGSVVPPIYSSYGILVSVMGNISEAYRFGNLATQLQAKVGDRSMEGATAAMVHAFLYHWKNPLQDSLPPLLHAFGTAVDVGEIDAAFTVASTYSLAALHCGLDLVELENSLKNYCRQMSDFEHRRQALLSLPCWQLCLNLLGNAHQSPCVLTGDAMNQDQIAEEATKSGHLLAHCNLNLCKIMACYFFDSIEPLDALLVAQEKEPSIGSHFSLYVTRFYVGLAYVALLHQSQKNTRRFRRGARRCLNRLTKWVKVGCNNCKPLASLVHAELTSSTSSYVCSSSTNDKLENLYRTAIEDARQCGFQHVEALANERAGRALMRSGHLELATPYLVASRQLYQTWGAAAKAEWIDRLIASHSDESNRERKSHGSSLVTLNSAATGEGPHDSVVSVGAGSFVLITQ